MAVPWARPDSGFTLLFEALVMMLAKAMPVSAVGRIVTHYVDAARAKAGHSTVTQVGVDETASRRGQKYVSLFVSTQVGLSEMLSPDDTAPACDWKLGIFFAGLEAPSCRTL